ncbi:hypothetical protein [Tumebacillus flagellatus]|uniref:Uncharacterized protein n=1 Tax=Tumebacillus flagellatus TaxID=1157490 RepID=A0A074LLR1_9BACL|nr:hypothetical protein [Tumebacillus flagellatus]KEO81495.1 hypothetical protein EL26_20700 [Tumebacillus flagellatus]
MFRPTAQQFATPVRVQNRVTVEGAGDIGFKYQDAAPPVDYCSWKGKGGTVSADSSKIIDTAEVTMWYRPDLNVLDRLWRNEDENQVYEILNIEDIEQRNIWLVLKVERVKLEFPYLAEILTCIGYGVRAPEFAPPTSTRCRIERRTDTFKASGYFPAGTAIKAGDRVSFEGITYRVEHIADDRGISAVAEVEVKLIEIRV